jgi:hypothetical protein
LLADIGEWGDAAAAVGAKLTIVLRLYFALRDLHHIAARHNPWAADFRQTRGNINQGIGIGIGARRVIDAHRGLPRAWLKMDLPHGDPMLADIDLL